VSRIVAGLTGTQVIRRAVSKVREEKATWGSDANSRLGGDVFRVERAHGPVSYAKYRLPDGWQVQKKIGPARSERRHLRLSAEDTERLETRE
jgi:hypothetical protein